MHQRLASRRSLTLIPQKPRQGENAPATASVRFCCIISREREKMPEIASFISPPDNSWSSIGWRPGHPRPPSHSYKVEWKNLLFNLFYQNPSSIPNWACMLGAPGGSPRTRSQGAERKAAPMYSTALRHLWLQSHPLSHAAQERALLWKDLRKAIWQHLSMSETHMQFHVAIRLLMLQKYLLSARMHAQGRYLLRSTGSRLSV